MKLIEIYNISYNQFLDENQIARNAVVAEFSLRHEEKMKVKPKKPLDITDIINEVNTLLKNYGI